MYSTYITRSSADAEGPRDVFYNSLVRNNKSDLETHSVSLILVKFDRPYMISY